MRKLIALALTVTLLPAPASAWGFEAHRYITSRAIDLLPATIRPFFQTNRGFVVEHSIDPDLWRNAGFTEEPPRHFVDLDAYGPYPFAELPRDFAAAVQKFGKETIEKNGTLPWRTAEMFDRLVEAFRLQHERQSFALENVKFFSAVLAHYIGDAHVPFHAILNYDGQLTNQHGIHSRFEAELFVRYRSILRVAPPPPPHIQSPRDFVFDTLLASFRSADGVLQADRRASNGRDAYDDAYFRRFFAEARPILERRLADAISGVTGVILSAWEKAGKPPIVLNPPRIPRPIRRPDR